MWDATFGVKWVQKQRKGEELTIRISGYMTMLQASLRPARDYIATVYRSESSYIVKIRHGDGYHAMPRLHRYNKTTKGHFSS